MAPRGNSQSPKEHLMIPNAHESQESNLGNHTPTLDSTERTLDTVDSHESRQTLQVETLMHPPNESQMDRTVAAYYQRRQLQNRHADTQPPLHQAHRRGQDRKSTRLNSSHVRISYAVFCLKKKKKKKTEIQQKQNNITRNK